MQTNDTSTFTFEKKMPYAYPITSHVWTRGVLTPSFTSPHQFRYLNLHVVRKYSSENIFQTTVIRKFQLNATSINVSCSLCYLTKQDCAAHWSFTNLTCCSRWSVTRGNTGCKWVFTHRCVLLAVQTALQDCHRSTAAQHMFTQFW